MKFEFTKPELERLLRFTYLDDEEWEHPVVQKLRTYIKQAKAFEEALG